MTELCGGHMSVFLNFILWMFLHVFNFSQHVADF